MAPALTPLLLLARIHKSTNNLSYWLDYVSYFLLFTCSRLYIIVLLYFVQNSNMVTRYLFFFYMHVCSSQSVLTNLSHQKHDESLLEDVWTLLRAGRLEEACNLCRSKGQVSKVLENEITSTSILSPAVLRTSKILLGMESRNLVHIWRFWSISVNWSPGEEWKEQNLASHWIGKSHWPPMVSLEMGFLLCIRGTVERIAF